MFAKKRGRKPGGSYAAMAGLGGSAPTPPPPENEYGPSAFVSGAAFEPPSSNANNAQKTGPKFGPRITSLEEEMDLYQEKIDGLSYEHKVLMAQIQLMQEWIKEEFGKFRLQNINLFPIKV
jgi:hypothetical protein